MLSIGYFNLTHTHCHKGFVLKQSEEPVYINTIYLYIYCSIVDVQRSVSVIFHELDEEHEQYLLRVVLHVEEILAISTSSGLVGSADSL